MTFSMERSLDGDRVWILVDGKRIAYATIALLAKLEQAERDADCGPRELWTDLIPYIPQPHTGF